MNRLADVELQLCMHGLEIKKLLQFARCSKQIIHAADSSFAWTRSALLCIDVPMPLPALHSLQSRLMRHAPLFVTLQSAYISGEHWMDSLHFAAISAATRRIFAFDASRADLNSGAWMRLLTHPCMRSVRVMRCGRVPASAAKVRAVGESSFIMRALIALPHLHTLQLEQHDLSSGEYSMLHLMPSLTSLSVKDVWRSGEHQHKPRVLLPLTACTGLKELRVAEMSGDVFASLQAAPNLTKLHSLTLDRFSCNDDRRRGQILATAPDFIAVFSALIHLQSLELIGCESVDLLLTHAHLAVSLRFVSLRPSSGCWYLPESAMSDDFVRYYHTPMPPPRIIAELLTRSATLQRFLITFHATKLKEGETSSGYQRGVERHFLRVVDAPELAPFGQRFQMRVDLGPLQLDSSDESLKRLAEDEQRSGCSIQ